MHLQYNERKADDDHCYVILLWSDRDYDLGHFEVMYHTMNVAALGKRGVNCHYLRTRTSFPVYPRVTKIEKNEGPKLKNLMKSQVCNSVFPTPRNTNYRLDFIKRTILVPRPRMTAQLERPRC